MKFTAKFLTPAVMYHRTHPDRVPSILQGGLKINSAVHLTKAGSWAHKIYGCNPIYLSMKPDAYKVDGSVLLKVNVAGLPLVADLPGLASNGHLVEDEYMIIYDENDYDEEAEEEEDETLEYEALLDPGSWEVGYAIKHTGTAAVLQDIEPGRIQVVS